MATHCDAQSNLASKKERQHILHPKYQKDQPLRRATSEILENTADIVEDLRQQSLKSSEPEMVQCECCGMSEECTPTYISRVKEFYCGKWVCGLCSEAVKDLMKKNPAVSLREALESHMSLCMRFNRTVLINPKLSFASSMKDIARRCSQRRTSQDFLPSRNVPRASS